MGITGLLPFLEKSSKKTNIREFSGSAVAIDSYCWLHKGVFSCAEKLMMGQITNAYVLYCMKYIHMLLRYKIKPIMVFDGRRLPAKEQTEIKRKESRQINRHKALELIQMGQVAEGKNLLKRAIDITHEIALELIKHCQNENIDCIVAPYEADAQLAYLNISNIADVVITEDSDLTLFGCKKIFFKMDFNGNGVLIEQDRLHLAMDISPEQFNMDMFRYICILSGCDYLPSLPGIGLGKAQKFIKKNTDHNIYRALTRMGSVLNMKSLVVTQEYKDAFILADITFKHQLVFCPLQRKQVRLNPPTADISNDQLQHAGKELDADLALQLALGNCDPSTLKMVHNFNPDKIERKRKRDVETVQTEMISTSIWSRKYDLKMKNNVFFENAVNSSIAGKELATHGYSLKNVSSKSHNSTMQCDRLSTLQNVNKNSVLDMYNINKDAELIANSEKSSEEYLHLAESNVSPELYRKRNQFVKQVSNLTTSPSVLFNKNYRKKGRNLMHIKRTVVDENIIIESKYFLKQNEKKYDILELENKRTEKVNFESAKCNITAEIDTNVYDIEANREQEEKIVSLPDHAESAELMKSIDDAVLSNQNGCLINAHEDISEITYSTSSSTNVKTTNLINCKNMDNSQDNLSKWFDTNNCQVSCNKKKICKEQNSANSVLGVNSEIKKKQLRQSKQLSSVSRQGLLSMYGFQKRSTLKH
nr:PREDICTED: LOW QUALITY PROTEIN: exonuclease 1 [Linepithema humile]